jgi:hypothetical protein
MGWLGKHFKLSGNMMYGLFSMLIGPAERHVKVVSDITREILRRLRIDEKHGAYAHLVNLILSDDIPSIKAA